MAGCLRSAVPLALRSNLMGLLEDYPAFLRSYRFYGLTTWNSLSIVCFKHMLITNEKDNGTSSKKSPGKNQPADQLFQAAGSPHDRSGTGPVDGR